MVIVNTPWLPVAPADARAFARAFNRVSSLSGGVTAAITLSIIDMTYSSICSAGFQSASSNERRILIPFEVSVASNRCDEGLRIRLVPLLPLDEQSGVRIS